MKAGLFGPRSVICEIEAFFDEGVDIDGSVLARALALVQQHVLNDRVCTLAVLDYLFDPRRSECLRATLDRKRTPGTFFGLRNAPPS
jgi:hypothetical protein